VEVFCPDFIVTALELSEEIKNKINTMGRGETNSKVSISPINSDYRS
jgi:hypothetical protein